MNLFKSNSSQGFTLIELLVVIGILGILAGTLFFAINPLEQLDRGNDAARKTAVESFVNAANSYYASQRVYPWDQSLTTACAGTALPSESTLTGTQGAGCVSELISFGELNSSYSQDTNVLNDILLTATTQGFAVCFQPNSTSEQNSAQAQYDADGTAYSGTGGTGATDRYWCLIQ